MDRTHAQAMLNFIAELYIIVSTPPPPPPPAGSNGVTASAEKPEMAQR